MNLRKKLIALLTAVGITTCVFIPSRANALDISKSSLNELNLQVQSSRENEMLKEIEYIQNLIVFDKPVEWIEIDPLNRDSKKLKEEMIRMIETQKVNNVLFLNNNLSLVSNSSLQEYSSNLYFKDRRSSAVIDMKSFRNFLYGEGAADISFSNQLSDRVSTRGKFLIGKGINNMNLETILKLTSKNNLNVKTRFNQGDLESYTLQGNISEANLDYIYNSNQAGTDLNLHATKKIGKTELDAVFKTINTDKNYNGYRLNIQNPDKKIHILFYKTENSNQPAYRIDYKGRNDKYNLAVYKAEFAEKPSLALALSPIPGLNLTSTLSKENNYGLTYLYNKNNLSIAVVSTIYEKGQKNTQVKLGYTKEF